MCKMLHEEHKGITNNYDGDSLHCLLTANVKIMVLLIKKT